MTSFVGSLNVAVLIGGWANLPGGERAGAKLKNLEATGTIGVMAQLAK